MSHKLNLQINMNVELYFYILNECKWCARVSGYNPRPHISTEYYFNVFATFEDIKCIPVNSLGWMDCLNEKHLNSRINLSHQLVYSEELFILLRLV